MHPGRLATACVMSRMPAQIFYSLSEWHTHADFTPSDVQHSELHATLRVVLFLLLEHGGDLPPLHRHASNVETALLVVCPVPGWRPLVGAGLLRWQHRHRFDDGAWPCTPADSLRLGAPGE